MSTMTAGRTARRTAVTLAASGLLALAVPAVAHADTPQQVIVTPGSTLCIKAVATNGAQAAGTATSQGAAFAVFRNGTVVYFTTEHTIGFGANFSGSGTYKVCATNDSSTNTKVTLTLLPS